MDIKKTIEILDALANGCSPVTGELVAKDSVLNERIVIRAIQIAIDHLNSINSMTPKSVVIDDKDIKEAVALFHEQKRNPTANALTNFFLATRQFKEDSITSNELYGKLKGKYTNGQLSDFFSHYLSESDTIIKGKFKDNSYRYIDFFEREKFNNLTFNAVNQLKEKIKEIGVLKTENLSDYVLEARKSCPRSYEYWSNVETELLRKAIQYTNDLNLLSECFQRGQSSIRTVGQKIILASQIIAEKSK